MYLPYYYSILAAIFNYTVMFRPTRIRSFPVPREYQRIHQDLYLFLEKARDISDVETTHRSYTMCQGVLQVFRRRLTLEQSIQFANTLPAGIRALYVADWDPYQPIVPFDSRENMTQEVSQLRPTHNFAPKTALNDVAQALFETLEDPDKFQACLQDLGPEAQDFWAIKKNE